MDLIDAIFYKGLNDSIVSTNRSLNDLLIYKTIFRVEGNSKEEIDWRKVTSDDIPIILAVAIASGITFFSEGMTETGLTQYIGQQILSYVTDIGTTVSEWWDGIGSISSRDNGQVVISNPTYNAIQNFLSWWRSDYEISEGSLNSPVYYEADYFLGCRVVPLNYGNFDNRVNEILAFISDYPDAKIFLPYSFSYEGNTFSIIQDSPYIFLYRNDTRLGYIKGSWACLCEFDGYYRFRVGDSDGSLGTFGTTFYRSETPVTASLSASQPASYDALELQDEESVALDLGATVDASATLEDILAEYLAKIVNNTATAAQNIA